MGPRISEQLTVPAAGAAEPPPAGAPREPIRQIAQHAAQLLGLAQLLIVVDTGTAAALFFQVDGEHAPALPPGTAQAILAATNEADNAAQPCWLPIAAHNGHAVAPGRGLPSGCSAYARLPLLLGDGTRFGYLAALDTARTGWTSADRDVLLFAATLISNLAAAPAITAAPTAQQSPPRRTSTPSSPPSPSRRG